MMSNLYNRIGALCKERGITVTAMCKESGASRASLSDLKMGRKQSLSADTLDKIASYLQVSVDYLLGRTDGPDGSGTEKTPAPEGGRGYSVDDAKVAFFEGMEDVSDRDRDLLWEDAREYVQFKLNQRKRKPNE